MPTRLRTAIAIVAKDVATIALLTAVLPVDAVLVALALACAPLARRRGPTATVTRASAAHASAATDRARAAKTILISGGKMTKALHLARAFAAAGHRVVLCESHKYWLTGHRFSRAVDRFATLPESGAPQYAEALVDLVRRERVDVYVPVCSPASSIADARARPALAPYCEVLHVGPETIDDLDDKYRFAMLAARLGLAVPKTFRITDPEDVLRFDFSHERRPYILKSIAYDSVRRLDLTKLPGADAAATAAFVRSLPISEANPWILQEFVAGTEYCTHGTLRAGDLRVHCTCESSAFQVNYEHVDEPAIEAWVRAFAAGTGITGQASFDFIEAADDGRIYAIECNPRTHSAIATFDEPLALADAYLDPAPRREPLRPRATSRPTYWIYHELWRLVTHLHAPRATLARLRTIARGRDAVFAWDDPLPFLMLHHWQIPLLLLADLRERRGWIRIDFNIGKLVQLGGD